MFHIDRKGSVIISTVVFLTIPMDFIEKGKKKE